MSGSRPVGLGPGELKRKFLHLTSFLFPLLYLQLRIPRKEAALALAVLVLVLLVADVVRLRARVFRSLFYQLVGDLVRRHEGHQLLGSTYLAISFLLCVVAFEPVIAATACGFLVVGDTAAALVGKAVGRVRVFDKTLEGSVACLAACSAVGWAISASHPGLPLQVALAGALVATLFELLPVPLDDNFRIPLSAGLVMHFLLP